MTRTDRPLWIKSELGMIIEIGLHRKKRSYEILGIEIKTVDEFYSIFPLMYEWHFYDTGFKTEFLQDK